MRCVAYCRVSTNESDQLNSLNNQISHYTELFKQKGYDPPKIGIYYKKDGTAIKMDNGIFADEGITGTKKKNRKAFQHLLRYAEDHEFDVIFCKNVQRFARNVTDGTEALKRLKQLEVKVIFEDGGLDSWEHEGIINMFLSIAQEESRMKSNAVKFGVRKAQQQGKWTSNCPYGYDRVKGYLQINEKEAQIIRKIYNWYLSLNWGFGRILRKLNEEKIPSKKGGLWYYQHVKNILTNPLYTGRQTTHKNENMDINVFMVKNISEDEWIVKNKPELCIITKEIFNKAQIIHNERAKNDKTIRRRYSDKNLFSNVCRCENCGGIMKRKRKRRKSNQKIICLDNYELVCQKNDLYGKSVCKYRNSVDESVILEFVKNSVYGLRNQFNLHLLDKRFEMYLKTYFTIDTQKQIKSLDKKLSRLKLEQNNNVRLNANGILTDCELKEFMQNYRRSIKKINGEKLKLVNWDKEIEEKKREFEDFKKYICEVDINKLTNADIKRIFSFISIGTFSYSSGDNELYEKYFKEANYVTYINREKRIFKEIRAEFKFLGENEMDIILDYYGKFGVGNLYKDDNKE